MEVCSYQHDEIVHNERKCPLCAAMAAMDALQETIENLKDEIASMENNDE